MIRIRNKSSAPAPSTLETAGLVATNILKDRYDNGERDLKVEISIARSTVVQRLRTVS